MAAFTWGDNGKQLTPESIAARRKIADAMTTQGIDYSPIKSWTQGAARVSQALLGALNNRQADAAEQRNADAERSIIEKALGGGSATAPVSLAPSAVTDPAPTATPAAPGGTPADAISAIESGGKYDTLGPVTKSGDRAHGKYQVMGANIGPWSKEALGQELTPEQFLANPQAQDAVFQNKFGQYSKKYGPEGAARAWFAGEGGMNNPNARDQLGTSVADYSRKFMAGMSPGVQTVAAAMPSNAQAYAPARVASADPSFSPAPMASQAPISVPPASPVAAAPVVPPQQVAGAAPQAAPLAPDQSPAAAPPAPQGGLRGVNPAIIAGMSSPYVSEGTKKILGVLLQNQLKDDDVKTVDLGGSVGVLDKHGNVVRQVPKSEPAKGPTFGVISEDDMGRKQYGWMDPKTQTTTAQPQAAGNTSMVDPALVDVHGEEFMTTLQKQNPAVAGQVRAIVEGRAPYPTGMLLKTPYGQRLAQLVTQADPAFESGNPMARVKMQGDLATGKLGQNNNALNTAIGHLGELSDSATKLNNSDLTPYNSVANYLSRKSGAPEVTNFNTVRDKVAEEFTRVYRGAGGSESDIKREIDNMDAANSPAQLHGAIANMARLAQSKIDANEAQYKGTMGSMAKYAPMVTDKTKKTLDLLEQREHPKPASTATTKNGINWSVQ